MRTSIGGKNNYYKEEADHYERKYDRDIGRKRSSTEKYPDSKKLKISDDLRGYKSSEIKDSGDLQSKFSKVRSNSSGLLCKLPQRHDLIICRSIRVNQSYVGAVFGKDYKMHGFWRERKFDVNITYKKMGGYTVFEVEGIKANVCTCLNSIQQLIDRLENQNKNKDKDRDNHKYMYMDMDEKLKKYMKR